MNQSRSEGVLSCAVPGQPAATCTSVSLLLLAWQKSGGHVVFDELVRVVLPELRRLAGRQLRRLGVQDPSAVDDAVSLVLDHLRRLPGSEGDVPTVSRFDPARVGPCCRAAHDAGVVYLAKLATTRARDVARYRRRWRAVAFSQLDDDDRRLAKNITVAGVGHPEAITGDRLRAGIQRLESRQRMLLELLLEGKSQAVIAHVLGLSEGTVSRLRTRAILALREMLAD